MEIALAEIRRLTASARELDEESSPVAGRPRAAAPAHRPHRQHAPRRVLHRQALQPRLAAAAGSDCSSCADSRCRRIRSSRSCRRCSCAASWRCSGSGRYTAPLVRWGTRLHEDFLLPEGATADIGEVVADLRAHGIAFEDAWLDAFTEFRFPRIGMTRLGRRRSSSSCGRRSSRGTCSAKRSTAGGTARYVDSSVERIQVTVTRPRSAHAPRDVSGCSGAADLDRSRRRVLRRRALPRLAAVVGAAPVDPGARAAACSTSSTSSRRVSLGGATYHVVHPGGRSYDHPPVNANEAEARRASRFEPHGHTAGTPGRRRRCARRRRRRVQPRLPAHARPAQGSDRVTPLE